MKIISNKNKDKYIKVTSTRNPIVEVFNKDQITNKIRFIGDPHLGRKFKTGVPSHRLGERESMVYSEFEKLLNPSLDENLNCIVIVGDLFDKFVVSPTDIDKTYNLISEAVRNNTQIKYVIIPGNHDLSKDKSLVSSYSILVKLLKHERVEITLYESFKTELNDNVVLYADCYTPFDKEPINVELNTYDLVISVGHFDSLDIIETGYIPTKELFELSDLIVSGHEHKYKNYIYPADELKTSVVFTGSLQPYSHAEDPDKDLYLTLTEQEFEEIDKEILKNKCVRILCTSNFRLTESIDCLSLSYKILQHQVSSVPTQQSEVLIENENYSSQLLSFINQKDFNESIKQELTLLLNSKEYLS